ncbi:DUF397 domain-containing protein [Amycolatopsis sp. CA-126428]|uniref:DUF397 domain-containing protein n=1 Tax=Amycolatopsis sp. CA-126428 TaxID=2073158 RepID=UPI000CD01CA3|nr:DUF397 domain-containing protein [Amycolatopsis sp. CA-126428]
MHEHGWIKSSASSSTSGNDCVEIKFTQGAVFVRDSKSRRRSLCFSRPQWSAFLRAAGEGPHVTPVPRSR